MVYCSTSTLKAECNASGCLKYCGYIFSAYCTNVHVCLAKNKLGPKVSLWG